MLQFQRLHSATLAAMPATPPAWTTMAELEAAGNRWHAEFLARRRTLATRFEARWLEVDDVVRTDRVEFMDRDSTPAARRLDEIAALHRLNRALLAYDRFLGVLRPHVDAIAKREGRPARALELASGHGELALAVARAAARRHVPVAITGSDINPDYVGAAQGKAVASSLPVTFRTLNAFALDSVAPGEFDLVFIVQTPHHFSPGQLAMMIAQARAKAQRFVAIDARRGLMTLAGLTLVAALARDVYFWHDAVVSARKFYSEGELLGIARLAAPQAQIRVSRPYPYTALEVA